MLIKAEKHNDILVASNYVVSFFKSNEHDTHDLLRTSR